MAGRDGLLGKLPCGGGLVSGSEEGEVKASRPVPALVPRESAPRFSSSVAREIDDGTTVFVSIVKAHEMSAKDTTQKTNMKKSIH
jgi:hypothetical protein